MHLEVHLILCGVVFCSKYCNFSFTFNFSFTKIFTKDQRLGTFRWPPPYERDPQKESWTQWTSLLNFFKPRTSCFCLIMRFSSPRNPASHSNHIPFPSLINHGARFQNLFLSKPFSHVIHSWPAFYHVMCGVKFSTVKLLLFLSRTLVFFF